jgi:hypothetical protein
MKCERTFVRYASGNAFAPRVGGVGGATARGGVTAPAAGDWLLRRGDHKSRWSRASAPRSSRCLCGRVSQALKARPLSRGRSRVRCRSDAQPQLGRLALESDPELPGHCSRKRSLAGEVKALDPRPPCSGVDRRGSEREGRNSGDGSAANAARFVLPTAEPSARSGNRAFGSARHLRPPRNRGAAGADGRASRLGPVGARSRHLPRTGLHPLRAGAALSRAGARGGSTGPSANVFVAGYEIDMYWSGERFAVELDGYEYHRTRAAFERDRLRQEELRLAGIDSIRITARRVERDPESVVTRLATLLDRRRRQLG